MAKRKLNSKQKKFFRYRIIQHIKYSCRNGNKKGFIKCWKGTTLEHFLTMCKIAYKLVNEGWEVYSEVEFESGGRADLLVLKEGQAYIIEVLHSETEERFSSKEEKYPSEVEILKVKTENFDIDEFNL